MYLKKPVDTDSPRQPATIYSASLPYDRKNQVNKIFLKIKKADKIVSLLYSIHFFLTGN